MAVPAGKRKRVAEVVAATTAILVPKTATTTTTTTTVVTTSSPAVKRLKTQNSLVMAKSKVPVVAQTKVKKSKVAAGKSKVPATADKKKVAARKIPVVRPRVAGDDSDVAEVTKSRKHKLLPPSDFDVRTTLAPLVATNGANRWWARPHASSTRKWTTLEHNGIVFPAPYVPHGVPVLYDGKPVKLTPAEEEVASHYAAMQESEHVSNPVFRKNFFESWTEVLKESGKHRKIVSLEKVDFSGIAQHLATVREQNKVSKADASARQLSKDEKATSDEVYGWAIMDGYREKVANYRVEPPGLFRGRGDHPKTGTLKRRIRPEDVVINIGENISIPQPSFATSGLAIRVAPTVANSATKEDENEQIAPASWAGVVHDSSVTWLAYFRDTFGAFKYIWLAPNSQFKGENDIAKYEKARRLKGCIAAIRKQYRADLQSKSPAVRQRAVAIYLIDVLALRVGNEKDTSEAADTVGCCSLRVEHVRLTARGCVVEFDFLGKDSMRYQNRVRVDAAVWKNLKEFCADKRPDQEIFEKLTTTILNEHLKSLMPGLSAKVFRTYNASVTLEQQLYRPTASADGADSSTTATIPLKNNAKKTAVAAPLATDPINTKLLFYNRANRQVAILCNHQRTEAKSFDGQYQKMVTKAAELASQRDEIERYCQFLGGKSKEKPKRTKIPYLVERKRKSAAAAGAAVETDADGDDTAAPATETKYIELVPDLEQMQALLVRKTKAWDDIATKMSIKQQSRTVALGTSKINYMDPRITVAWCKKMDMPIEKVFNKSLCKKFPWAMETEPSWRF